MEWNTDAQVILICNALRHHEPVGEKTMKGAVNRLDNFDYTAAPELFERFRRQAGTHAPEFAKALQGVGTMPHIDQPPIRGEALRVRVDGYSSTSEPLPVPDGGGYF